MPSGRPLATFIQLSDLHIGHLLGGKNLRQYDARIEWYIRRHLLFDGMLGHQFDALEDIEDFVRQLQSDGEHYHVIFTGDLTRNGHPAQFALAVCYLGAALPPAAGGIGLGKPDWQERAIPGNHDHWPGTNGVFGGPTSALRLFFGHLPGKAQVQLPDGRAIEFISIDTDADVDPWSLQQRLRGRGAFLTQLSTPLRPARRAAAQSPNAARVLLMHHSISHADPRRGRLEIEPRSRSMLHDFVVRERVSVVLSGHIHEPMCHRFTGTTPGGRTWNFLEARCGTSAVRDAHPSHWPPLANRTLPPNALMLHRVHAEQGGLEWRTWICRRLPGQGFEAPLDPSGNTRGPDGRQTIT